MSMLPTATQTPVQGSAVKPDAVYGPNGETSSDTPAWEALNPCPVCGMTPHDAPEGTNFLGDPHYVYEHCWKCGYRPALNNVVSRDEMQRQFEAFQEFIRNGVGSHPTLEPPPPDQVAQMQAQIQQLQDELASRNAAPVNTPSQSFTPNTQPNIPDQPPSTPANQVPPIQQPGDIQQPGNMQGGNG